MYLCQPPDMSFSPQTNLRQHLRNATPVLVAFVAVYLAEISYRPGRRLIGILRHLIFGRHGQLNDSGFSLTRRYPVYGRFQPLPDVNPFDLGPTNDHIIRPLSPLDTTDVSLARQFARFYEDTATFELFVEPTVPIYDATDSEVRAMVAYYLEGRTWTLNLVIGDGPWTEESVFQRIPRMLNVMGTALAAHREGLDGIDINLPKQRWFIIKACQHTSPLQPGHALLGPFSLERLTWRGPSIDNPFPWSSVSEMPLRHLKELMLDCLLSVDHCLTLLEQCGELRKFDARVIECEAIIPAPRREGDNYGPPVTLPHLEDLKIVSRCGFARLLGSIEVLALETVVLDLNKDALNKLDKVQFNWDRPTTICIRCPYDKRVNKIKERSTSNIQHIITIE